MSAALGRVQMSRLEELLEKRAQVAGWYDERLAEIPGVETPQIAAYTTRPSWFVYVVRFAQDVDRDGMASGLAEQRHPCPALFHPHPLAALHG